MHLSDDRGAADGAPVPIRSGRVPIAAGLFGESLGAHRVTVHGDRRSSSS